MAPTASATRADDLDLPAAGTVETTAIAAKTAPIDAG